MATVTVISPVTGKPVEHKRVAAYCRVSSNSADQENSYQAQIRYFTRHIKANRDWELVDIFADATVIIGLKQNPTHGRRFSPIFFA